MSLTAPNVIPAELTSAPAKRLHQVTFGAAFGSIACLMFLATLMGMYLNARQGDELFYEGVTIPLTQPNVQFFTMVLAGFMVSWAAWATAKGVSWQAGMGLAITSILGLAFANQTWFLFDTIGLGIGEQAAAPYFYAVTATHLAMVLLAVALTLLTLFRVLAGSYGPKNSDAVVGLSIFWYATIIAFAVVWLGVYIHK